MNDPTAAVADGCLSLTEAVKFSGMSRGALYALMAAGQLAYVQKPRRRLIPRKALCDLLAADLISRPADPTGDRP